MGNLVCGADEIVDGLLAEPRALERLYELMQAQHKGLVKEALPRAAGGARAGTCHGHTRAVGGGLALTVPGGGGGAAADDCVVVPEVQVGGRSGGEEGGDGAVAGWGADALVHEESREQV